MTDKQENKLRMFNGVYSVCTDYSDVWNAVPAFDRNVNNLKSATILNFITLILMQEK